MKQKMLGASALVLIAVLVAAGCRRETPAEESPEPTANQQEDGAQITLKLDPDPPAPGENEFVVTVTQNGRPVTDAQVEAELLMPAMPSMNMPEMKNTVSLPNQGDGTYRGKGLVMMAGAWNITVRATRGGETIGTQRFAVNARAR